MTVASLWKALDRAGCGKRVGANELRDHHHHHHHHHRTARTNPWNIREMQQQRRLSSSSPESMPVLAVDLSIWICEALTSSAMQHNHNIIDPALQLVYSRTLKLLNLGIRLVVVVEGKRRILRRRGTATSTNTSATNETTDDNGNGNGNRNGNGNEVNHKAIGGEDTFRKRRSGARFWTACERCEELLKLLGIAVVRATAEGEALCALLNQRGIVDGVISNDGDCLLYGAKVIYTKFSVDNLDHSNVIRYDATNIRAIVDDDDAGKYDETGEKSKEGKDVVKLSRPDLIAFAILTGSDLAGDGISKVGCRKAIRFIRKCQIDNPLKAQENNASPALDLLLSWEQAAISSSASKNDEDISGPHCGCCGHPGTKTSHKKHGCDGCGTKPGEPCFQLSPGGRFRKLLRAKALDMRTAFDPSSTIKTYHEPNENQIPLCLVGKTARTLNMNPPQLEQMLQSSLIVRGRTLQESREFVRKSLSAYLARRELFGLNVSDSTADGGKLTKLPTNSNRPIPTGINKRLVRAGKKSYEIKWVVKATTTDAEGNPLDRYEFSTIEDESAIDKCYPKLVEQFEVEQRKIQQQGTAEQEKRRAFLLDMEEPKDQERVGFPVDGKKKNLTRRDRFHRYQCSENNANANANANATLKGLSDDVKAILVKMKERKKKNMFQGQDKAKKRPTDVHIGRMVVCTSPNKTFEELETKQLNRRQDFCTNFHPQVTNGSYDQYEQRMNDDSSTIKTNLTECHADDKAMSFSNPSLNDSNCDAMTPGHGHYLGTHFTPEFCCAPNRDDHLKIAVARQDKSMMPVVPDKVDPEGARPVSSKRSHFEKKHAGPMLRTFSSLSVVEKHGHESNDGFPIKTCGYDRMEVKYYIAEEGDPDVLPTTEQQYPSMDKMQRRLSQSPLLKRRKDEFAETIDWQATDTILDDWNNVAKDDSKPRSAISHCMSFAENYQGEDYNVLFQSHRSRHEETDDRTDHLKIWRCQRDGYIKSCLSNRIETRFSRSFDVSELQNRDYHREINQSESRHAPIIQNDFDSDFIAHDPYRQHEHLYDSFQKREENSRLLHKNPNDEFKFHRHDQRKDGNMDRLSRIQMLRNQIKILEREQNELENNRGSHCLSSIMPSRTENLLRNMNDIVRSRQEDHPAQSIVLDKTYVPCAEMRGVQDMNKNCNVPFLEHNEDFCASNRADERDDLIIRSFSTGTDATCDRLDTKVIDNRETQNRHRRSSYNCYEGKKDNIIVKEDEESIALGTFHHGPDSNGIKRREIDERVAMKFESRNRRAQVGLLCARYIEEEECWNNQSSL